MGKRCCLEWIPGVQFTPGLRPGHSIYVCGFP